MTYNALKSYFFLTQKNRFIIIDVGYLYINIVIFNVIQPLTAMFYVIKLSTYLSIYLYQLRCEQYQRYTFKLYLIVDACKCVWY